MRGDWSLLNRLSGLTWLSLSYVCRACSDLSSTCKPCKQGKQAVAHPSHTSCLWCKFLGQGFGSFCTYLSLFLTIPHKEDQFCLAAKGYYNRKYSGRRTSDRWCYNTEGEGLPTLCFCFCHFSYQYLKKTTWQNILKLILSYYAEASISTLPFKEEWQDIIFRLKWKLKKKVNGQQYVILIPYRSGLSLLQRHHDQKMGGRKKKEG